MDIFKKIASDLEIGLKQVESSVKLIDEGNTIPFIARYRKEVTGNLSDEVLRELDKKLSYYRNLNERIEDVKRLIEGQGKLTEELEAKLNGAETLQTVEDIYLPYRPKKRTRATIAEEKGLRPLAEYILEGKGSQKELEDFSSSFIDEEKEILTFEDAISYAKDIMAGDMSENADIRTFIAKNAWKSGAFRSSKSQEDPKKTYQNYYEFAGRLKDLKAHMVLALFRGEKEGLLKLSLELDDEKNIENIIRTYTKNKNKNLDPIIEETAKDSYTRLIFSQIETQLRKELKEDADQKSIEVFKENLSPYLMQAPMKNRSILGMDPGYRTGCKLAVISEFGEYLDNDKIFPTFSEEKIKEAEKKVIHLIEKYNISLIALGNGTASRETEKFIGNLLKKLDKDIKYVIVSESGASIYSASKLGTEEFPDLDVTVRGAISIARRLQDPLAELVKIEPKHIGVGQYQHDINQKELDSALDGVVEASVNKVGVDVNTASISLLKYVAGISEKNARAILKYKREKGKIKTKNEISKVKGIGPKTFQQCAGFLRVPESDDPLDNTGVHPESFEAARKLLGEDLTKINIKEKAEELKLGELTLRDIIEELKKPGRDPREDAPKPHLRSDVLSLEDLEVGMELTGTVRNVVDFGAFVDIGIGTDGLVHISEISDKFIKHPSDLLSVSDIVKVKVIKIDKEREKVSLSMK